MTSDSDRSYVAPSSTIILTTVVLVFFFVVFCSVYICRCVRYWINMHQTRGMHDSIMKKFPTFTYATVKNLREDKFGLECAICLTDFADEDVLRLLTTCSHVFHKSCIDTWLVSNYTCPVCRTSLNSPDKLPINNSSRNEEVGDSIRITIEDEVNHHENGAHSEPRPMTTTNLAVHRVPSKSWVRKLSKSNSTGHWSSKNRISEEERWRLPEHLLTQLINQQYGMTKCSTAREIERPRCHNGACLSDGSIPRIKMSL